MTNDNWHPTFELSGRASWTIAPNTPPLFDTETLRAAEKWGWDRQQAKVDALRQSMTIIEAERDLLRSSVERRARLHDAISMALGVNDDGDPDDVVGEALKKITAFKAEVERLKSKLLASSVVRESPRPTV